MHLKTSNLENNNIVVIYLVVLIVILLSIQIACQKEIPEEIPSLSTVNITDVTSTSITSGGLIFSTGGDSIRSRGLCLSIKKKPGDH